MRAVAPPTKDLGRRERQIVEILYKLGRASVTEVRAQMDDPPSYSAVRTMLNYLESKGYLRHERDGIRYLYLPTAPKEKVRMSALRHVVDTFFDGSVEAVVLALFSTRRGGASPAELARLRRLIDERSTHEAGS
jgi:predicted transcriptional regulator